MSSEIIDYRLAPKYNFPAANEDVTVVYRELLKDYKPQDVGMRGFSAGGALAAMALAWFQKEGLPAPGVASICSAGFAIAGGDSRYVAVQLDPSHGFTEQPLAVMNVDLPESKEMYAATAKFFNRYLGRR